MSHGVDIGRKLSLDEYDYLRARGDISFVARYYDGTRGASAKALSTDEVAIALSRGLAIATVFETTGAGPWTYDQGKLDGAAARADALACGQPLGTPICAAVDKDVLGDPAQIVGYLNGFFEGLAGAYTMGLYAEFDVIKAARESWPGVAYFWQTYAWSGGREYAPADLYQYANGVTLRPGLVVDLNIARSPVRWRIA